MATGSTLGDYLRVRRERLRPDDVGLPAGPRRRVPGLRREKLALPGAPGQMLITYHAEPGSPSHERLSLLAHLAEHPGSS